MDSLMKNKFLIPVAAVLVLIIVFLIYKFISFPEEIVNDEPEEVVISMADYLHSPDAPLSLREQVDKYYGCLVNKEDLACAYSIESSGLKNSVPLEEYGKDMLKLSSFVISNVETNGTSGLVEGKVSFSTSAGGTTTQELSEIWIYQDDAWYHGSE